MSVLCGGLVDSEAGVRQSGVGYMWVLLLLPV
jgi:hypothetical protein